MSLFENHQAAAQYEQFQRIAQLTVDVVDRCGTDQLISTIEKYCLWGDAPELRNVHCSKFDELENELSNLLLQHM